MPDTTYELLIQGGTLLTGEPGSPFIENAAVGVSAGRFAFVGERRALPKESSAQTIIDAADHLITPGLVNIHTHAILALLRGASEDLAFAPAYVPGIPHGHEIEPDEAVALARLGALELMLFGTTLINDSYVHADLTLPAMAELGLRVFTCGRIHDADFSRVADGVWEYSDKIGERTLGEALSLAERWHGAENGRIGVQLAPHATDTCTARLLRRVAEERQGRNLRATIHLAQSKAEVSLVRDRDDMTPVELLDHVGLLDAQTIGTHCLFVTEADVERMGRARMNMAHGPKVSAIAGMMAPTSALRREGVNISVVTDAMHGDMIEAMRWALALGRLQEGEVSETWQSRHVFEMATGNPARAMGLDDDLGSIAVGKKADVVIIDIARPHLTPCVNPVGSLVHVAQGRDVRHVVVDGRVVVADGRPTLVDGERVRKDGEAASRRVWERAGRDYLTRIGRRAA